MEFYHLLNRGVDKRDVFLDNKDLIRFIHDLFEFNDTAAADRNIRRHTKQMLDVGRPTLSRMQRKLLVQIHAFCLMPNHYHILVSPLVENGVSLFMKKLNGGYAKYFNERYKRDGALWQGKYKSVPITTDAHLTYLPFYIHFNPLDLAMYEWRERKIPAPRKATEYLKQYRWSSHLDYLGIKNFPSLTQREFLTKTFDEDGGYKKLTGTMLKNFSIGDIAGVSLE